MTAAAALAQYSQHVSPKYAKLIREWLDWGGRNNNQLMTKYVRYLLDERGLRPSTVDLHVRAVQAFYRHFGLSAPEPVGFHHDARDTRRPTLTRASVRRLVRECREGTLSVRQTTLLALSTVYGMRAAELAAVEQADVQEDRLYIRTVKHGVKRWCYLPPELKPYLQDEWHPVSADAIQKNWTYIMDTLGVTGLPERTGWHSIRRELDTELRQKVSDGMIKRFLRWRGSGRGADNLVDLYGTPTVQADLEEGEISLPPEVWGTREYDQQVWDAHPFLSFWTDPIDQLQQQPPKAGRPLAAAPR